MNKSLWTPSKEKIRNSNLESFRLLLNNKHHLKLESYLDIHHWSVNNLSDFWENVWTDTNIKYSKTFSEVIDDETKMPGAKWFKNSRLNFAENLLNKNNSDIAIEFYCENKISQKISYKELYDLVAKVSNFLIKKNIKSGDRVAAIMPNIPETIVCMLACASIGAVWSSCSPDFGSKGILDRFKQIKPKILISTDGYFFKGKIFKLSEKLKKIKNNISSIKNLVIIDYTSTKVSHGHFSWKEICNNTSTKINFSQEAFDHPLYIMFSSGTTGMPKSIVHSAGGTLIQHFKELKYHVDLKENDKIFYYTTCGWMMWNWLVSSLAFGCTIVLYEGNPFYPDKTFLLKLMNDIELTIFGTSAKYISTLNNLNINPKNVGKFKKLKTILSTGSPLTNDCFEFVYKNWKKNVQLSSISGGTDIISCFALGNPMLPVFSGELQCIGLGMSVKSFNEDGQHNFNTKGELVCNKAFPSLPIYFWNDRRNKKYINSYFNKFKNVWTHGDYILITKYGGVQIFGRSDATLNPGGVRIGTSEIYQVLESIDYIDDSLLVGQKWKDDERIVLFLKLFNSNLISDKIITEVKEVIKKHCSPRHIPNKIIQIQDIPYTVNGKKVEIAVKNIIHGINPDNKTALANPESLEFYKNIRELQI